MPSSSHRVVITGMGMITPLGNDVTTSWHNARAGRSGLSAASAVHGLGDYHVASVGRVTGEQPLLDAVLPAKFHTKTDRFVHLALIAGHEAVRDAGLATLAPEVRAQCGVYIGVGIGGLQSIEEATHDVDRSGLKRLSPFTIPKTISNIAPAWLAMQWELQGPLMAFTNACASSSDALGMAFRLIRDGYTTAMLAGGAESCMTPLALAGFGNMRALSTWAGDPAAASRPFERNRSGFVLSEGASMMVLEQYEHAVQRGAPIYAEIVGYGASADAYHCTAMHPEGRGAMLAMERALADARLAPAAIDYINAHGTGTAMNDVVETMAIKKVFGDRAYPAHAHHVVASSTKSMSGHLLGAAGSTEAVLTACALRDQCVPPTINLDDPDPVCDLDYVPHMARDAAITYAMSNSFGFGGGNAVLILKRSDR
jgi:3-oxoacyl-[acyl-carrier-protein] synthase II